jgi:uncharacterized protein (TIGR04255 family)
MTSKVKYSNAPISNVSLAVIFNDADLINESIFFEILTILNKKFEEVEVRPTFEEEIVVNGLIQRNINFDVAGFTAYGFSNPTENIQVNLQQNLVFLQWARNDDEDPGHYPGFESLYEAFTEIWANITLLFPGIDSKVKSYALSYVDRVPLQQGDKISEFVNIKLPEFESNNAKYFTNSIVSALIADCSEVNGHCMIKINTPTLPIGRLLIVENKIKGVPGNLTIDEWFNKAHKVQEDFFSSIFNEKLLYEWK